MAEIRFNYGDKFTQTTNTNTGIGSTIPAGKLDVAGAARVSSHQVTRHAEGFRDLTGSKPKCPFCHQLIPTPDW